MRWGSLRMLPVSDPVARLFAKLWRAGIIQH